MVDNLWIDFDIYYNLFCVFLDKKNVRSVTIQHDQN